MRKAIKRAKKHAEELERIAARNRPKPRRGVDDEKLVARVARKLRELFYGPKTYLPKKDKKVYKTAATKRIERGLKQAGIKRKKIRQLRD